MTHYTNTSNPIDFPKVTYKHIVQVHPVENGEPNLYKVVEEAEFETFEEADCYIKIFNRMERNKLKRAVYVGRVNTETGELE